GEVATGDREVRGGADHVGAAMDEHQHRSRLCRGSRRSPDVEGEAVLVADDLPGRELLRAWAPERGRVPYTLPGRRGPRRTEAELVDGWGRVGDPAEALDLAGPDAANRAVISLDDGVRGCVEV